jgi:hypothetical protein
VGDTAAVAVEFKLTSTVTPSGHRTAQLKATVEERVAADLGVSSVTVDDFAIAVVQTSRRLGLIQPSSLAAGQQSHGHGGPSPRKLATYDWTTSFTVKAGLGSAGLASHSALATSVTTTLTSAAFVSQASSRAQANVDTATVAAGVTTVGRPSSAPSLPPTSAPTTKPVLAPTVSPVVAAAPPTGAGSLTGTPAAAVADAGDSSGGSSGGGGGGPDMASLGGIIGGVVAVLLVLGCVALKVRQQRVAKAHVANSVNEARESDRDQEMGRNFNRPHSMISLDNLVESKTTVKRVPSRTASMDRAPSDVVGDVDDLPVESIRVGTSMGGAPSDEETYTDKLTVAAMNRASSDDEDDSDELTL